MLLGVAAVVGAFMPRPLTLEEANLAPLVTAIEHGETVTIEGLGSSVGNGHSLAHPERDAPVAHLGERLAELGPVEVQNHSVNGSSGYDGILQFESNPPTAFPTVVLLAYGMNDGMPYAYNAGATFPGNTRALASLARAYRDGGSTVLLATTPSPNTLTAPWELAPGQGVYWPIRGGPIIPAPADSVGSIDGVPFSVRHAEFNDYVRELADSEGYVLIDTVPSWLDAVRTYGQTALFSPGQYNHPNLLGHQNSYWPPLDAFVASVAAASHR